MSEFYIVSTETDGAWGMPVRGVVQLLMAGYACYRLTHIADGRANYAKVGNLGALEEAKRWAAGADVPLLHWTVEEVS